MSDARTAFWTFAILNMAAAFTAAAIGIRHIRAGRIAQHRTLMRTSAVLVGLFVAAYGVKIFTLGRENLSAWSFAEVAILRIHEAFIFTFLVAGGRAFYLANQAAGAGPGSGIRTSHRLAGRIAMIAFSLALLTAGLVYRTILTRPVLSLSEIDRTSGQSPSQPVDQAAAQGSSSILH